MLLLEHYEVFLPPIVACLGIGWWKVVYRPGRPLTRRSKVIAALVLFWSMLPLLLLLLLIELAQSGQHLGN